MKNYFLYTNTREHTNTIKAHLKFKPSIYEHSFFSFLFSSAHSQPRKRISTDIMRKTVKLMISISNKSNLITTNTSLILREIMRCLHQHRMLIYWRVTTIRLIQIQIGIIITIIDIRMPHQVRKVRRLMSWDFIFAVSREKREIM